MKAPETTLSNLLKDWQQWPISKQPVLIKEFTQGKNHCCYLIRSGKQYLVLKKFSAPHTRAIRSQEWASELNIAPKIVFCDDNHCLALMEYVPHSDSATTIQATQLANTLKLLHNASKSSINTLESSFDLLSICDRYLERCDDKVHELHQQLKPALEYFINDQTPHCLCHNDLVKENCLVSNTGISLIDWEFSQTNNPWFDIACVIVYQDFDQNQSINFLNAYDKQFALKINTPIYYSSQLTVLWVDILWHLFMFGQHYWPHLQSKYSQLKQISRLIKINLTTKF